MLVAEDDDLGTLKRFRAMYATLTSCDLLVSSTGARERLDMIPGSRAPRIHYETPRRAAELIADFADHQGTRQKEPT